MTLRVPVHALGARHRESQNLSSKERVMSMIGVLGGMGPAATADFMAKLVQLTPAACDQEHLPVIVAHLPQVPDRSRAILAGRPLAEHEDPLPALYRGLRLLNNAGAGVVVMPSHTAHHWYSSLVPHSPAPILHIGRATMTALPALHGLVVGVLATRGTLRAGFYQRMLVERGMTWLLPDEQRAQLHMDACIAAVKAGRADVGALRLQEALVAMQRNGAETCLLGCAELPLAAARIAGQPALPCVDPTLELARAAVQYALSRGWGPGTSLSEPSGSMRFNLTGVPHAQSA
jgi:aspartate racemase